MHDFSLTGTAGGAVQAHAHPAKAGSTGVIPKLLMRRRILRCRSARSHRAKHQHAELQSRHVSASTLPSLLPPLVSDLATVLHCANASANRMGHAFPVLPRFPQPATCGPRPRELQEAQITSQKAGGHPCPHLPCDPVPACPSMKLCRSGPPQPRRLPMRCQARKAGPEKKPSRSPCVSPNCAHTRCHTASWPACHQRSLARCSDSQL